MNTRISCPTTLRRRDHGQLVVHISYFNVLMVKGDTPKRAKTTKITREEPENATQNEYDI